jgi:hypothetical protein
MFQPLSLGDRAVDGDLVEDESDDDSVVGLQRDLLEPGEDAESDPQRETLSGREKPLAA